MEIKFGDRLIGNKVTFSNDQNEQAITGEIFSIDVNNRYKNNLMHSMVNTHGHVFISFRMQFGDDERIVGYNLTTEKFTWYIDESKWRSFKCVDRRLILDKVIKTVVNQMIYELRRDAYVKKSYRKMKQDKTIRFIWDMGIANGYKSECDELVRVCRELN